MKTLIGKIASTKMDKTVSVVVESIWEHPLYQKRIRRHKKYLAHTDQKLTEGQTVTIQECRPISKNKCWIVKGVVE